MNILIGLLPAIGWGFLPIFTGVFGGKPINQLFGTSVGGFIVALLIYLYSQPQIDLRIIILCLISGMLWSFGQITQYMAFKEIGVSTSMPISTGLQLIGNSLIGVAVFGEWKTAITITLGFFALFLIIIGIILTTFTEKNVGATKKNMTKGILYLVVGNFGYMGYSFFPRWGQIDGWSAIFPQTVGMVLMTFVFVGISMVKEQTNPLKERSSYTNLITGLLFGLAVFFYLISIKLNGIANGFTLSQMCVVISTTLGIFILKESKTKEEMIFTFSGLFVVIIGGLIISVL
ncbi:ribose uptake protein RbsU [Lactobacillus sp. S2-2]|uniref:GRP family sugar transporter n=1 Tax=Lactobacillus sp. S2-2 TaxID=2692917 RepID=UPI001F3CE107|nr:GRP family sugar transporter [Lactobacillus sp. S2-2]MCF6514817.1 ribose uptake protein RbsU [Lactobacillus sp. S2-2]